MGYLTSSGAVAPTSTYLLDEPPPPPPEEQVPPPPEQQAAPPPQAAPVTYMLDEGPPPQAAAPAPQQAAPTAPPEAANLPPATPRAPQGPTALEQVPVIGPPLQALGNLLKGGEPAPFRPAPEGVQGQGPEAYRAGIQQAEQGVAQAQGPLETLGAVKDLGLAHLAEHKGEISPEAAGNKRAMAELGYDLATSGQAPAWAQQPQVGGVGPSFADNYRNDPFVRAFQGPDRDNLIRAYEEGYTTPEGVVWAPGPEAAWEYYVGGLTGPQRVIADQAAAPLSTLADVAATVLTAGGSQMATRGTEIAQRGLGSGKALEVGGKALEVGGRAIDAAGSLGLSEAVPGAFKVAGKAIALTPLGKPTARAVAEQTGEETAELGGALLGERRIAGTAIDAAPRVTEPKKGITQIDLPAEGGQPAVTIAYQADKSGVRVFDDPGTYLAPRRATPADLDQIEAILPRLSQREHQQVREPWWRFGMRTQDAAGDDLIEPISPVVRDAAGNVIADAGRNRAAHQRHVADLVRQIEQFDDPDGASPVLFELLNDWRRTLSDNALHPLTREPLAAHRLQTIKDVVGKLPSRYNTPWLRSQLAAMEGQIPAKPGLVGTGRRLARTKGGARLVATTVPEQERLAHLASRVSTRDLWGGKGKRAAPGFVKRDFASGLLDRRAPLPGGPTVPYENYQAILSKRLTNPVLQRGEVGAIRQRFLGAIGSNPSPTAQRELDGLKDALDRNGILPGANGMTADEIGIALAQWQKANPPFRVSLPPGGATITSKPSVAGLFPPGSADELLGTSLPDDLRAKLEQTYDIGGATYRVADQLVARQAELEVARRLAQKQAAGTALSASEQRQLTRTVGQVAKMFREYAGLTGTELAGFGDGQLDRLAGAMVQAERGIADGLRSSTGRLKGGEGPKLLQAYDQYLAAYRSLVLYSPARGIAYPLMQGLGNAFTTLVAAPGALRYYTPVDYRAVLRMMRDPEVADALMPRAIRLRQAAGAGRSANLGRVSRDQIGGRTWFNDPSAGGFRRGIGKILAPQWIKDAADGADTFHRQILWLSLAEPAYARLKKDLPQIAETTFQEARRRTGLTLPLSRDQIATALRHLEDASPEGAFTPTQLREALLAAAGGPGAANRTELFNAADRVARTYREEFGRLDAAAMREVDRVAFNGGDTTLDAIMQRTFLFSWWSTRAARLYLTEMAKSPIQMGLWARAVHAGEQRRQGGASEAYQNFIEFMRTPAGFTMALNPLTLSTTVGTFAKMDEPSPLADLTGLGRLVEGGFLGNNLFLSPLVKASLGWIGALGADYRRPDLTGVSRLEREVNDAAEYVNYHLHHFFATKDGAPTTVPNLDLNAWQDAIARHASGLLPGTMAVPGRDAQASEQGALTYYVTDEILKRNPELAAPDDEGHVYALEHAVEDAMATPDSEVYQAALATYVDTLHAGFATDKGGALAVIGAIATQTSPFSLSGLPTSRADRNARVNRDSLREDGAPLAPGPGPGGTEKTAVDSLMSWLPWQSEAGRAFERAKSAYYGSGDPQVQGALETVKQVRDATIDEPITVLGITFTPEQIGQLSEKDRNRVAYAWLDSQGYGDAQAAQQAAKQQALVDHPELADAFGWEEYIAQYPGGIDRAVDDTALVNPNVRAIVSDPKMVELRKTNHDDWVEQIGYLGPVVAGVQESRFGTRIDPAYRGVVGGLAGQTVGAWYLAQGGGGSQYGAEKAEAVSKDLEDYTETLGKLNAFDPSGATAAQYTQNLLAGSAKPIPYAAYKAGITGFTGSDGTWFRDYLTWGMGEPADADTSPERWVAEDQKAYDRKRTIEIAGELAAGTYVATTPVVEGEGEAAGVMKDLSPGLPTTGRPAFYQEARAARGATVAARPNGQPLGPVPPDATLTVLQVGTDPAGTRWALVVLPDGSQGYVKTAELRRAA